MISHKHKCIFIHLPRTAGTAIEFALRNSEGNIWLKHITQARSEEEYSKYWNDYKKFTVVRNPFDWLVSYIHLDAYHLCDAYHALHFLKKKRRDGKLNFKRLVRRLIKTNDLNTIPSPGWFTQRCRFFDTFTPSDMDLIIKFEDLEKGIEDLSKLLDSEVILPAREDIPEEHCPKTIRTKNHRLYYDPETRDLVTSFFAEELDCFGYKF